MGRTQEAITAITADACWEKGDEWRTGCLVELPEEHLQEPTGFRVAPGRPSKQQLCTHKGSS